MKIRMARKIVKNFDENKLNYSSVQIEKAKRIVAKRDAQPKKKLELYFSATSN